MSVSQLEAIYKTQRQRLTFFADHVMAEIERLANAPHLGRALLRLQNKLIGTAYADTLQPLEDLAEQYGSNPTELAKQVRHLFFKFNQKHADREGEAAGVLIDSIPQPRLTPSALFYATAIYNQQENLEAIFKAKSLAEKALDHVRLKPQLNLAPRIRQQYAYAYDRWLLRQNPPQPQKYGMVFNPLTKELVPPVPRYQYNLEKLAKACQELGLNSYKERLQQERRHNLDKQQNLAPKLASPQNKRKKEEEEKLKLAPKCPRCGRPGHSGAMCGYAPKQPL